jgi:hypothetical protein
MRKNSGYTLIAVMTATAIVALADGIGIPKLLAHCPNIDLSMAFNQGGG